MHMDAQVLDVVRRPSRLRALSELAANAESSAGALDRIARIACRVLDVPVALVNLVGEDQQRFVGCGGPEPWASMREMPITAGFCPFALGAGDAYALEDAREQHPANPAVDRLGVAAYAGVPLRSAGGEPIGTLCAIDYEPRTWSEQDLALLSDLAAAVVAELQLLAASRLVARHEARLGALAPLSAALASATTPDEVAGEVLRAVEPLGANAVRVLRDSAEAQTAGDGGSLVVLPLSAGDRQLGALAVSFPGERARSADDRDYLAAVAGVTALALAR
jgi:GAF domain-containing protein